MIQLRQKQATTAELNFIDEKTWVLFVNEIGTTIFGIESLLLYGPGEQEQNTCLIPKEVKVVSKN